jgi:hypothetical protein
LWNKHVLVTDGKNKLVNNQGIFLPDFLVPKYILTLQ